MTIQPKLRNLRTKAEDIVGYQYHSNGFYQITDYHAIVSYIVREGGVADWRVCIRNAGLTRARRAHQETLVDHEIGEPLYATMTPVVLPCESYDAPRH